jgi:hypothetical protein
MQSAIERHFTVLEVSELWQLHPDTVRKMFRDQPGVLKIGGKERRGKQGYVTLRIPESVLARVHAERTKVA